MAFIAVHFHCICGAPDFKAEVRKGPALDLVRRKWAEVHTGAGHGPRPDVFAKAIDESLEDLRALIEAATTSEPPL